MRGRINGGVIGPQKNSYNSGPTGMVTVTDLQLSNALTYTISVLAVGAGGGGGSGAQGPQGYQGAQGNAGVDGAQGPRHLLHLARPADFLL